MYVFDPTGFSEWPDPVGWDPVAGCEDPQVAIYRARALNAAAGSSQGIQHADYFQSYNEAIHRCYLHAAAVSGRDIATVRQWVNRAESHDAIRCLRESPRGAGVGRRPRGDHRHARPGGQQRVQRCAARLRLPRGSAGPARLPTRRGGRIQRRPNHHANERRSSSSARRAPRRAWRRSSPHSSRPSSMRPSRAAARSATRRLTPPLGLFLDECANIAPLPSLPQLVTDGAGQGITTMIVLQSLGPGAGALGGRRDRRPLGRMHRKDRARRTGRHPRPGDREPHVRRRGHRGAGPQLITPQASRLARFSHRRVPAFAPAQVRTLRRWHGLLFYEELRPIETALAGWWELDRYRSRVEQARNSFASSRVVGAHS